ncbi:Transaldolase [Paramyrothecium foliicola]|nr:Transaldolase [Paramyrothecium foliicola]
MPSLLDSLRQVTQVDCDTLDSQVAQTLGPFVDCTSNQAIAYFELSRQGQDQALLHHEALIKDAVHHARGELCQKFPELPVHELVVDVIIVKLQLLIISNLSGFIHVQTNPKLSYSAQGTVDNAERIVTIFKSLAPDLDPKRLCIKIPSTWEGLQACRILEEKGIATLATTMFCMEQAALAADAKCTYIAPYVNELKVHFEKGYTDQNKAFDFCREAQAYYLSQGHRTLVLAASLTSVDEVMQLAGIQHITISPGLLQELANRDATTLSGKLGEYFGNGPDNSSWKTEYYGELVQNESQWRLAFTRSGFGTSEGKIVQAIDYFSDFQEKIEELSEENARSRINTAISQDQADFVSQYAFFNNLIRGEEAKQKTLDVILMENFTQREAQLFTPPVIPGLDEQQERNTAEYEQLLSTRFDQYDRDDLALKLTLLYFGLPIEPMIFPFERLMKKMEVREPEPAMYDVEPPLHFLTAHKERNWGRDELRGREDIAYPLRVDQDLDILPYQRLPLEETGEHISDLGLRGGGDDAVSDNDGGTEEDSEKGSMSEAESNSKEGGEVGSQFSQLRSRNMLKVFGFQGWVSFEAHCWHSYTRAVAKLLSICPSQETEYTLIIFDEDSSKVVNEVNGYLAKEHDRSMLAFFREEYRKKENARSLVHFVKLVYERSPVHWAPQDKGSTVANVDGQKVAKVLSEDGLSCCYISFPSHRAEAEIAEWGVNQYSPYIRAALEVLTGVAKGTFHDAFFQLTKHGGGTRTSPYAYGLHMIHPLTLQSLYSTEAGQHHILKQKSVPRDSVVLYFPTFVNTTSGATSKTDNPEDYGSHLVIQPTDLKSAGKSSLRFRGAAVLIKSHVRKYLKDDYSKVYNLLLVEAETLLAEEARPLEYLLPANVPSSTTDKEQNDLGEFLDLLQQNGKKYVMIQPQWKPKSSTIQARWHMVKNEQNRVALPPLRYSNDGRYSKPEDFRLAIKPLLGSSRTPEPRNLSIKLLPTDHELGRPSTASSTDTTFFLPNTITEKEWANVRSMITTRDVLVDIVGSKRRHWKHHIDNANPWGPRYKPMLYNYLPRASTSSRRSMSMATVDLNEVDSEQREPSRISLAERGRSSVQPNNSLSENPSDITEHDLPRRETARSQSWIKQPSIFDNSHQIGHGPRFPITAPPVESFLRTSSNVPMISKAVLTLSEQVRLQRTVWDLRNMLLGRVLECQYENCEFYCSGDERNTLQEHIKTMHQSQRCLWCSTPLYEWWTEEQRENHLRQEHSADLARVLGKIISPIDLLHDGTAESTASRHAGQSTVHNCSERPTQKIIHSNNAQKQGPVQTNKASGTRGGRSNNVNERVSPVPIDHDDSSDESLQEGIVDEGQTGTAETNLIEDPSVREFTDSSGGNDMPGLLGAPDSTHLGSSRARHRRRWKQTVDGEWIYESDSAGEIEMDEKAMEEAEREEPEMMKKRKKVEDGSYKPSEVDVVSSDGEEASVTPSKKQRTNTSVTAQGKNGTLASQKSATKAAKKTEAMTPKTSASKAAAATPTNKPSARPSKAKQSSNIKTAKETLAGMAARTMSCPQATSTKQPAKAALTKRATKGKPASSSKTPTSTPSASNMPLVTATPASPTVATPDLATRKRKALASTPAEKPSVAKKHKTTGSSSAKSAKKAAEKPSKKPEGSNPPTETQAPTPTLQRMTRSRTLPKRLSSILP